MFRSFRLFLQPLSHRTRQEWQPPCSLQAWLQLSSRLHKMRAIPKTAALPLGKASSEPPSRHSSGMNLLWARRASADLTLLPDGTMVHASDVRKHRQRRPGHVNVDRAVGDVLDSLRAWKNSGRWYLVNPSWFWVHMWDSVTSFTLLVIALFTPFEVAFLEAPTVGSDPLFVMGRVIDGIFIFDMLLHFVLMTPKSARQLIATLWVVVLSLQRMYTLCQHHTL